MALVAGEASGDQLGAELIKSLRRINPCIRFDGIGGPLMIEQGFNSLLPIEEFSVMGISEIVKSLPRLLKHRKTLVDYYHNVLPDAFIGIDYPEFNFSLEKRLKQMGIYTVHYVSPSVWAWREKRIYSIQNSCDLMLTLFGFEKDFYDKHNMPAIHCGHPLLDMIPESIDVDAAKTKLGINTSNRNLAILPGSRESEISKMLPVFIATATNLQYSLPELHCFIPAANQKLEQQIHQMMQSKGDNLQYTVVSQQAKEVMTACDAVLLASGTATLEAMLLQKPMVVAYKVSGLTAILAKRMVKISNFSLPNILADHVIVPEYMQDEINPQEMADALYELILPTKQREQMIARLVDTRKKLRTNGSETAAKAIYDDMIYREIAQ
ncbi:MAG: lipid-A-disaccharide synthase [Gammaproteobacteria bacterium]|nr:lipid-A-disaccharide synthase [Gammaproteobacteria bacterium]